jgi:hypothetical protein
MFFESYPPAKDGKHSNEVWALIRKIKPDYMDFWPFWM